MHSQLRTKSYTAHAAHTQVLVDAHNAIPISIDGMGCAHVDTLSALRANVRVKSVVVVENADR